MVAMRLIVMRKRLTVSVQVANHSATQDTNHSAALAQLLSLDVDGLYTSLFMENYD
jgi:hypothetical protein